MSVIKHVQRRPCHAAFIVWNVDMQLLSSVTFWLLLTRFFGSHDSTGWAELSVKWSVWKMEFSSLFFFKVLFILRERGREGEKHQCMAASRAPPYWGLGPQPRHVLWLGIKLVTLWFTGWRSIHWATPARGSSLSFVNSCIIRLDKPWCRDFNCHLWNGPHLCFK